MGIKNFGQLLKAFAPSSKDVYPLSNFCGHRVAIDGHLLMYKHMSIAQKIVVASTNVVVDEVDHEKVRSIWLDSMVNSMIKFISAGITPIFVYDGPAIEAKQTNELVARRKTAVDRAQKLANISAQISSLGPLLVSNSMIKEKKKLLSAQISFRSEDINILISLYRSLGIPVIRAAHDGEKLCSALVVEGVAVAVLSTDTDNLVFGCPNLITNIEGDNATVIQLQNFLSEADLTFAQFTDLCILSGCDYNNKIPGIGPKTAYRYIQHSKSLEEISKHIDTTSLDYVDCRRIFRYKHSSEEMFEGEKLVTDMDSSIYQYPPNETVVSLDMTKTFNNIRYHIARLKAPPTIR